jgi:hypothetical protein
MNAVFTKTLHTLGRFFGKAACRRFFYLGLLCLFVLLNLLYPGFTRMTFVFYTVDTEYELVEERMLSLPRDREKQVAVYVEESLLGPASQDTEPLFPRDTRLESLLFRNGVVYLDLSENAVLPLENGGDCFRSLSALNKGIRRNFNFVKEVRLFITGNEAFPEKFREKSGII